MSHTTVSAEDWITREDMAALMRSSTDTVRRDEAKIRRLYEEDGRPYETRTDEAGRVLVNVGDFVRIGRLRPEDLTLGATPAESAEVLRARDTITALKAQVAELSGRLAQTDLVRDTLREQLAVKDKQIGQQTALLTQLVARLGQGGGAA